MSKAEILIVGSVALDDVKTPSGEVREVFGGSASYASMAARLFGSVHMVAIVGTDFPSEYHELLHSRNIDTEGLEVAEGKTFRWGGVYGVDLNSRKTLFTQLNVFEHFHPKVPESYRQTPYVFLANIHPSLQAEVLAQVTSPKLVALDTMNLWLDIAREDLLDVLKSIDLFVLNEEESRQLTQETNLMRAGKNILQLGPKIVIIKKGEHGALMFTASSMFSLPALILDQVSDPTGAGDAFAGALMGYVAATGNHSDRTLREAVAYGTVVASFTVEDFGLKRLSAVSIDDIRSRFQTLRELTQFGPESSLLNAKS